MEKRNNIAYYCKDEYLPKLPKDIFLNNFYKLHGHRGECVSYAGQREFVHLSTSEPCIISPVIDVNETQVAYGQSAIPKLLKEVMSSDKIKSYQALNTLASMLYRPEKAVEAIHGNIVGRLVSLLSGKEDFICMCALACLRVLCIQPGGKHALLKNECTLPVLKNLLKDCVPEVRYHAVITVHTFAINYTGVHAMVKEGFIEVVMDLINNINTPTFILIELLELLELLLDDGDAARMLAITCDALEIVGLFSNRKPEVKKAAAAVIAQLFHCPIGKIAATHKNIIAKIKKKLNDPDEGFKAKLITALMFATTDIEARKVANNASLVMDMLDTISYYYVPTELEISALKVLTNLAELPQVRKKLNFFLGVILGLPKHSREDIQRHINTLIDTIMWTP